MDDQNLLLVEYDVSADAVTNADGVVNSDGIGIASGDVIANGDVIVNGDGHANGKSDGDADVRCRGGDICPVCLSAINIYCVGACNHPLCLECCARLLLINEKPLCPICRRHIRNPLITDVKATYKILPEQHEKITSASNQSINSSSAKVINAFNNLVQHQCPKCPARVFKMLTKLQQHMVTMHELYYCSLCINNLDMLTCDRIYYTSAQLKCHLEKGDRRGLKRGCHPLCRFCGMRFFNLVDYVDHCILKHYFCGLCRARRSLFLFGSFDELLKHRDEYHFPCLFNKCDKLFDTCAEFVTHMNDEHAIEPRYVHPKINRKALMDIEIQPFSKWSAQIIVTRRLVLKHWIKPLRLYNINFDFSPRAPKPRVIFDFHDKLQFPPLRCKQRNIKEIYKQLIVPVHSTSSILTTNGGGENTSIISKPTYAEVAASFCSKF